MLATQAGLDRRIFYDGDEWQNVCNFYALTLLNGEDEDCGGTHNTESDYMNLKNKVENKIIVPTVSMLANASYDKTSLYVDVKIKTAGNEAKNLDIFLFILDDTKVKAYLQKPAKIDKKQNVANLKFLFPYGEISAYKNLRAVAIIQEDKKILNARVIEYNDIREIKILKEAKELKNESKEINKEIYKNITEDEGNKSINMTAVSGAEVEADIIKIANPIKNSINFMYCVVSRDTLFCAISNLFEIAEIKSENIKKGNFSISWSK
ncbi:MAG: hypothetical protein BWK75_04575 [Candidatus Altiarchaeales archaeon A3]|nr:MAG: hypothetical protein BWK75_04575 [Candidatus Altiarchaeales archaeon A3]